MWVRGTVTCKKATVSISSHTCVLPSLHIVSPSRTSLSEAPIEGQKKKRTEENHGFFCIRVRQSSRFVTVIYRSLESLEHFLERGIVWGVDILWSESRITILRKHVSLVPLPGTRVCAFLPTTSCTVSSFFGFFLFQSFKKNQQHVVFDSDRDLDFFLDTCVWYTQVSFSRYTSISRDHVSRHYSCRIVGDLVHRSSQCQHQQQLSSCKFDGSIPSESGTHHVVANGGTSFGYPSK